MRACCETKKAACDRAFVRLCNLQRDKSAAVELSYVLGVFREAVRACGFITCKRHIQSAAVELCYVVGVLRESEKPPQFCHTLQYAPPARAGARSQLVNAA